MPAMNQRASDTLANLIEQMHRIPTFAALVMVDGRTVLEHKATEPLCACSTFKVTAATAVMALVRLPAVYAAREF